MRSCRVTIFNGGGAVCSCVRTSRPATKDAVVTTTRIEIPNREIPITLICDRFGTVENVRVCRFVRTFVSPLRLFESGAAKWAGVVLLSRSPTGSSFDRHEQGTFGTTLMLVRILQDNRVPWQ